MILLQLSKICENNDISLIVLRQYGLIGSVRTFSREVCAIESKPADVIISDLRLVNPFPELKAFAMSIDLNHLDSAEHSHCPYAIILIQALEEWKSHVRYRYF